ncbi:MAG: hypothetical protein HOO67_03525, partial [Candidatus Peribacteraceae bacterium]|nr:hypothetical protein [Candidatus Peribacteraceae bacterium]
MSPIFFPHRRIIILCIALVLSLLVGEHALAKAVITEVHWAGSDLSTSDEWIEIAGIDQEASLSGWTLTTLNSSSAEVTMLTFPDGTVVRPGEFLVVSRFVAAQSRLLSEPAFITSAMSLPNTKLLLRLRDANGQVMDQADDGTGSPFAGTNSTSPVLKASMERVDLSGAGDDVGNWVTATEMVGWANGQTVMRGTPGFARIGTSVGSSSASSQTSSSASSASSASSSPQAGSSASTSCPVLDPYFILQSGATSGADKVTLNIQLGTHQGSLTSATCVVDFDDETVSQSCNPPSHTYDEAGTYTITAEVKNSCGTVTRTMPVTVTGSSASSSFTSGEVQNTGNSSPFIESNPVMNEGKGFVITGVLPNPAGKDPGNEWVEIRNVSNQTASLDGWTLRLPHAKKSMFTFGSVSFFLHESKRFSDRDLGMTLGNTAGELSLINPAGETVQTLSWKDARDGITYSADRPSTLPAGPVKAKVLHVIDGDTLDVALTDGGHQTERVRLIGIDAPELHASDARQMLLGRRATDFLRSLVEGETVTLEVGPDERDSYGR